MSSDTLKEELVTNSHFSWPKELEKKEAVKKNGLEGRWGAWGEVTATAGVSWDAGQDVDSLFHFPSAFILPTIPCLHPLLLLLPALTYCKFLCLDLSLTYLILCLSLSFLHNVSQG